MNKIHKKNKEIEGFIIELKEYLRVNSETLSRNLNLIQGDMEIEYKDTVNSIPDYKKFYEPKYKKVSSEDIIDNGISKYQYAICDLVINKNYEKKNILIKFSGQTQSFEKDDYNEEFTIIELDKKLKYLKSYITYYNSGYNDAERIKFLELFRTSYYRYEKAESGFKIVVQGNEYPIISPLTMDDFDQPTIIDLARNCYSGHIKGAAAYTGVKDWHFFTYISMLLALASRRALIKEDDYNIGEGEIVSNVLFQDADMVFEYAKKIKFDDNKTLQKESRSRKKIRRGYSNRQNALKNIRLTHPLKIITSVLAKNLWNKNPSLNHNQILPKIQGAIFAIAESNCIRVNMKSRNHTILDWVKTAIKIEKQKPYYYKTFEVFKNK